MRITMTTRFVIAAAAFAVAATLAGAGTAYASDEVVVLFNFQNMGKLQCAPTTWQYSAPVLEFHDQTVQPGSTGKPLYKFKLVLPWVPCASLLAKGVAISEVAKEVDVRFYHAGAGRDAAP